jgi:hypothetical protein
MKAANPCLTPYRPAVKLDSMFRDQSWIRRAGVTLLVLTSFVAAVTALPHDEGLDDLSCSPLAVAHDETAHYIGALENPDKTDSQHCFLCHSTRSFCSVLDRFVQRDDVVRGERPHTLPIVRSTVVDWTVGPGRAPPA